MSVVCQINCSRRNYVHAHAQSQVLGGKNWLLNVIDFDYALEQLYYDEKETFT